MKQKFKKGDKISIEKRFKDRDKLMRSFIKIYKNPVLVHATPVNKLFKKILIEGKLRVPEIKDKQIEHSYIERMLGIYPCIFLSLGFMYATAYEFKYSFIFDLNYLKKADYYKNSISYQAYKAVVKYWDENEPSYLEKLAKKNKICREVVNKFYNEEYQGKKKAMFDFWKVEKETFELIQKYPKKKVLLNLIKKNVKDRYIPYPASMKVANEDCFSDNSPEVIIMKDINLLKDKFFLGFYIMGDIPKDIISLLLRDYPDKILFDGKKIRKIGELG